MDFVGKVKVKYLCLMLETMSSSTQKFYQIFAMKSQDASSILPHLSLVPRGEAELIAF